MPKRAGRKYQLKKLARAHEREIAASLNLLDPTKILTTPKQPHDEVTQMYKITNDKASIISKTTEMSHSIKIPVSTTTDSKDSEDLPTVNIMENESASIPSKDTSVSLALAIGKKPNLQRGYEWECLEFLKTLTEGEVNHPTLEVTVSLEVIPDLTTATLNFLRIYKVDIKPEDQIMLEQVTMLQVKAKVAKARAATPGVQQPVNDHYVDKTIKHLTQAVKSHKLFIDQVGVVEHQKQLIVPIIVARPAENRELGDDSLSFDVDNIIHQYTNFIQRVSCKLKNAVGSLDFENIKGSTSILVGSRLLKHCDLNSCEAWSSRDLPVAALALGGGFRFGFNSTDILHNEHILCCICTLDLTDFLAKIQNWNLGTFT